MIVKNQYQKELYEVFDSNHKNYIEDRFVIENNEFIKYVYVKNNLPIGYVVIYDKPDFVKREHFDIKFEPQDGDVYIWHLVTRKGYEGRGVASRLISQVIRDYKNHNIFVVIETTNIPSLKVHIRLGFEPVCLFSKQRKDGEKQFLYFVKKKIEE